MTGKKAYVAALVAAVAVVAVAPAAFAQSLPGTDTITDTVTDTVDTTTDTITDTSGGITDTVTDTVDTTTDTVTDTSGGITDTTTGTTDTIDDTTSGTIDDTTGTIDDTTSTIDSTTSGTIDTTTGTIDDTKGTIDSTTSGGTTGGSTVGELLDDPAAIDEAAMHGSSPATGDGWIHGKKILSAGDLGKPKVVLAALSALIGDLAAGIAAGSGLLGSDAEMQLASADSNSFLADAGRAAVAAAKALAFPLALALLVVGFLAIQGRIGRKDPKLLLAPVDATEDTLSFE